jgi:hypothetical protein
MTEQNPIPRCGDTVFHIPTGEEWLVAWADGNELSWCGWPPGIAKLSDCIIRKRCTDEEHRKLVWDVSLVPDFRGARVKRLYAAALDPEPASPLTATAAAPEAPRFPDHVHEGAIEAGLFRLNFVAQKHVRVHYDAALAEIVTQMHAEIEALKADLAQHFSAAAECQSRPQGWVTFEHVRAEGQTIQQMRDNFFASDAGKKLYARGDTILVWVNEGDSHSIHYETGAPAAPKSTSTHPDDIAVDEFATQMKAKLAIARLKGRAGWQDCDRNDLWRMLRNHVQKGDVRDIANYCMMIWHVDRAHAASWTEGAWSALHDKFEPAEPAPAQPDPEGVARQIAGAKPDGFCMTVYCHEQAPAPEQAFVSVSCIGETCTICDEPATKKVGEEILQDDPYPMRHNMTAYVCATHFEMIFSPAKYRRRQPPRPAPMKPLKKGG